MIAKFGGNKGKAGGIKCRIRGIIGGFRGIKGKSRGITVFRLSDSSSAISEKSIPIGG
ncbi:hypothetical protein [Neobacillus mesonae]|uniref:hypothetical protein n=1 Tax=Neobacillus mesonae TaxID=1193713 RepID=UPI00204104E8|nr:hypothetical protein [Neobacillus mesonae]MCM3567434.1 hypothetical protein [Neobacillus mesonae]